MAYADILKEIMKKRPEVVVLTSEARKALGTIPDEFPERFYDFGIAEQNMAGAAAGMAAMGKIPVIHAPLAAFITMRPLEHLRTSAAMQGRNVKIPGLLPGFSAAFQGPSHVSLEDIALMRVISGVTVMEASCERDLKEVVERAFEIEGCVYFRIPSDMPKRFDYCRKALRLEEPRLLRQGNNGLVITSGGMIPIVLDASRAMESHGRDLAIAGMCVLDPPPVKDLISLISKFEKVVTVEEHFITGGLGSIVAEIIADCGLSAKLFRLGVNDVFPDRFAERMQTLAYIGLDSKGVTEKLKIIFR